MRRAHKKLSNLSLAIIMASAMAIFPLAAEAKTINWPADKNGPDEEAKLRNLGGVFRIDDVLYIDSSLTGNMINVSGDTKFGAIYGALSMGTEHVSYNILNIMSGEVLDLPGNYEDGDAVGGYSRGSGDALRNTVNMSGGKVGRDIIGGLSYDGSSNYNTVNFSGGEVKSIHGGFVSNMGNTTGGASYNTVNITGGKINGNIYGGDSASGTGFDQYNTVNISGNVEINDKATIAGGNTGYTLNNGINAVLGNTLNMDWVGKIGTLTNFENLNFVVSDEVLANDNTILKVDKSAISHSKIKITAFKGEHKWQVGDKITVISKTDRTSELFGGKAQIGLTHKFDYDMVYGSQQEQYSVIAKITGYGVNEDAGDLPSGEGSTNEFLKGSADLIDSADLVEEIDGLSRLIGVIKHSRSKFGSGSTADVNGTAILLGTSRKYQGDGGYIMLGGFVEGGWGSYSTNSNFGENTISSSGKNSYHGLGIAARNIRDNGVYTAATLRLGRAFTHHKSANLANTNGDLANYDSASVYYGINLGIGKNIKINSENTLDVYGKYLFLHQTGSDQIVAGDKVSFNAINSHRLRAGMKVTNKSNTNLNTYIDLAYEYELNGKATATAAGDMLPYISVKGGTAIAEVGLVYKPKNVRNFETKLGFQGYVGKRQGYAGNLNLIWTF